MWAQQWLHWLFCVTVSDWSGAGTGLDFTSCSSKTPQVRTTQRKDSHRICLHRQILHLTVTPSPLTSCFLTLSPWRPPTAPPRFLWTPPSMVTWTSSKLCAPCSGSKVTAEAWRFCGSALVVAVGTAPPRCWWSQCVSSWRQWWGSAHTPAPTPLHRMLWRPVTPQSGPWTCSAFWSCRPWRSGSRWRRRWRSWRRHCWCCRETSPDRWRGGGGGLWVICYHLNTKHLPTFVLLISPPTWSRLQSSWSSVCWPWAKATCPGPSSLVTSCHRSALRPISSGPSPRLELHLHLHQSVFKAPWHSRTCLKSPNSRTFSSSVRSHCGSFRIINSQFKHFIFLMMLSLSLTSVTSAASS